MSRDPELYLADIVESCARIRAYTEGFDRQTFDEDQKTVDAVIRNLEIIGVASKHLSPARRQAHPEIEWRKIAGLRDMLAHAYFGIDLDIVWDIVQHKIPPLQRRTATMMRSATGRPTPKRGRQRDQGDSTS